MKLIEDAKALEEAGCFSFVIECVPEIVGTIITKSVHIPSIGMELVLDVVDKYLYIMICWACLIIL